MKYFSIIVPVYNVEKYLKKCVESIMMQNFSDFELILVDDGSTDKSSIICDSYLNFDNVSVIHKKNGGLSTARNIGIERANGKWCVFVDSDDYIGDNNFLNKLYKYSNNQDLIIYGCSQFIDGSDKIVRYKYNKLEKINSLESDIDKLKYLNLTNNVSISAWTHAIRKQFIDENKLFFDENIRISEDIDWFFRVMLSNPRISALDGNQYFYRIRKNSLSRNKKEEFWKYRYNAIKKSEKYINDSNCDIKLKNELFCYLAYQYMILLSEICDLKNNSEVYSQVSEIKYLLKYGRGLKNMVCKCIINIFGVKKCSKIVSRLKNI